MTEAAKVTPIESDDELLRRIQAASATIEVATRNKKQAEAELLARRKDEITALLKAKDEPYGKVDIVVGNHKVEVTSPKKVEWEQPLLKKKNAELVGWGEDPSNYMQTEYNISETLYKTWDDEKKKYFADARTVKTGTTSIKIVEEK